MNEESVGESGSTSVEATDVAMLLAFVVFVRKSATVAAENIQTIARRSAVLDFRDFVFINVMSGLPAARNT